MRVEIVWMEFPIHGTETNEQANETVSSNDDETTYDGTSLSAVPAA